MDSAESQSKLRLSSLAMALQEEYLDAVSAKLPAMQPRHFCRRTIRTPTWWCLASEVSGRGPCTIDANRRLVDRQPLSYLQKFLIDPWSRVLYSELNSARDGSVLVQSCSRLQLFQFGGSSILWSPAIKASITTATQKCLASKLGKQTLYGRCFLDVLDARFRLAIHLDLNFENPCFQKLGLGFITSQNSHPSLSFPVSTPS